MSPTVPIGLAYIEDRICRAEENIEALKPLLRTYYETQAHRLTGHFNPATKQVSFHSNVGAPPERFFTLLGDILHELRSSLDQTAWILVEHAGNQPNENTKWPILSVAPMAPQSGPNRGVAPAPHVAGGVSASATSIIENSQPYKKAPYEALHPLWALERLNIVDKHRHVVVERSFYRQPYWAGSNNTSTFDWTCRTVSVSEYGAEVAFDPVDEAGDTEGRATFQVVLYEVADGVHREVIETLAEILGEVRRVFAECVSECTSNPVS